MTDAVVRAIAEDIKKLETDAIVVGFFEDVRPLKGAAGQLDWLLCGALSALIQTKRLSGAAGEIALLTPRGKVPAKKIFLAGMGQRNEQTADAVRRTARMITASVLDAGAARFAWEFMRNDALSGVDQVAHLLDGMREGAAGRPYDVSLLMQDTGTRDSVTMLLRQNNPAAPTSGDVPHIAAEPRRPV